LAHSKTDFVTINGANLYYEVAGSGYPLVLIHAGVADSRMWDEQFAVFAEKYHVVRYDLRGFGKSSVPAMSFASHDELAELLIHLSINKTHVVGISYGSRIALDFTLAYPELVAKLVLVAPSVSGSEPTPDVQAFYDEEEDLLDKEDMEAATELNLRMWVDGPQRAAAEVDPKVRSLVHDMQLQAFQTVFPAEAVERDLEPPAILRLNEVIAPTLIVVGDYDLPSKLEISQHLQKEIPNAQLAIFPAVAHMVNLEQPEEFNKLVLEFLN
jgi:pimeloyl-ACP methyl ester carboxylesterase